MEGSRSWADMARGGSSLRGKSGAQSNAGAKPEGQKEKEPPSGIVKVDENPWKVKSSGRNLQSTVAVASGPAVVRQPLGPSSASIPKVASAPAPISTSSSSVTGKPESQVAASPGNVNVWQKRLVDHSSKTDPGSPRAPPVKKAKDSSPPPEAIQAPKPAGSGNVAYIKKGDSDEYAIVQQFNEKLTVIARAEVDPCLIRPLRPRTEPPSKCQKIRVRANHFPVKFANEGAFPKVMYHYDVVITPKEGKESKKGNGMSELTETTVPDRLLHVVWQEFEALYSAKLGARMPFDGKKNCYTVKPLNLGGHHVWSGDIDMIDPDDDDKRRKFRIQLKFANEISTELMWSYLKSCVTWNRVELPQDIIQALDVSLRYSPSIVYTPCNRSFFSNVKPHNISDLLELWFGHNQSLLLGRDQKATLNIDMANKAFIKKLTVVDLFGLILRKDPAYMARANWSRDDFRAGNDFLKGKLLEYGTGKVLRNGDFERKHRFVCVEIIQASDAKGYTFQMNGVRTNICDYFLKEKGIKLKHPDWPVIHVGNKNMTNYVPIELLSILPQAYKGKLEARDTSEMIKGAAKPPLDRFSRIQNSRNNCHFEKCKILKDFGLAVENKMVEIEDAKKLPLPSLHMRDSRGQARDETPHGPDGKFNIGKLLDPAKVPTVTVLNAAGKLSDANKHEIKQFLKDFGEMAGRLGLTSCDANVKVEKLFDNAVIYDVKTRPCRDDDGAQLNMKVRETLAKIKNDSKGTLVLVLMGKDGNEYATIKAEAEVKVGILTQCVKWSTVEKVLRKQGAAQVLLNIILKVNAKLNGKSFQLGETVQREFGLLQEPVLFLGADVTHPAPNSKSPSVAAITGSVDREGMKYNMHIQLQPQVENAQAQEVITDIDKLIVQLIYRFLTTNKTLPKRIIMFRDGVSEGQFAEIKRKEFQQGLIRACEIVSGKVNKEYKPKLTFLVVKKRHHTRFLPIDPRDSVKPKGNIPPGTVVDSVITHPTEMEFFLNSHVGIQGTSKPTRYHVIHDDNCFTMEQLEKLTYYLCYTFVRCTQPVSYPAPTYYAHLAAFRARALLESIPGETELSILRASMTVHDDLKQQYPMFFV